MNEASRRIASGDLTVLPASMAAGVGEPEFGRLGIDFAPAELSFDAHGITLGEDDHRRLAAAVARAVRRDGFWHEFHTASGTAGRVGSVDLAQARKAVVEVAAAALAAPLVRSQLRALLASSIEEQDLDALAWAGRQPEAAESVHDMYRLALSIASEPPAAEIVREMSGNAALRRLRSEHPGLHEPIAAHVRRFGWLRAQSGTALPMTERELVQRISIVLVRWKPEMIESAAQVRRPAPCNHEADPALVSLFQLLTTQPEYGIGGINKAVSGLWPVLRTAAERIGCGEEEVVFATAEEVSQALSGQEPDKGPIVDRRTNGFVVRRGQGCLPGTADGPKPTEPLQGQTGSMGRAVGRAKVILDADDGDRLRPGDVLVTELSTPTYEGDPSLFPYRTVPSVAIDKTAAVVTEEGGLLSHAGIICRENSVPSIIGAEGVVSAVADGQVVEVDATKGAGRLIVWSSPLPPAGQAKRL